MQDVNHKGELYTSVREGGICRLHWCPKCNMMMPVVDEIEEVYKEQLEVVRIDIEKETEIAKDYSIQIVPTFVIMKQGNEVMRMAGIIGEEILKKRIEAVIGK